MTSPSNPSGVVGGTTPLGGRQTTAQSDAASAATDNDRRIAAGGCWPPPDIRARMKAVMSPAAVALRWRKPTDHPQDYEDAVCVAPGIGGQYSITEEGDHVLLWMADDGFVWKSYATVEDAKAAAETDWQLRYSALAIAKAEGREP